MLKRKTGKEFHKAFCGYESAKVLLYKLKEESQQKKFKKRRRPLFLLQSFFLFTEGKRFERS